MAPTKFPPGLLLFGSILPSLLIPYAVVFAIQKYAALGLPNYIWIIVYLLVLPAAVTIRQMVQYFEEEREIKRLGARRVPQVTSSLPFGIDILMTVIKSFSGGYMADEWEKWHTRLGPIFDLKVFGDSMFITTEPDHIKAMLATDFENFEKGEQFRWYVSSVLGTGVFNSDGDMWKFHRSITRPFFVKDRVTDFETFNHYSEIAVEKLKERFAEGEAVDFQDIVSRFTLDSATEFLFGSCVHSLAARLPYAHNSPRSQFPSQPHSSDDFASAFTEAQYRIALRARLSNSWPIFEFWKDKTTDNMAVLYDYIDPILKEALRKKEKGRKEFPAKKVDEKWSEETLLDHLVEQTEDPTILKDETLNIMIAGRDTTMATLTFVIYCLSQNSTILAKLREEILAKVGPSRRPTFEDVKECKYLRAVINETLRLYPPVPVNLRRSKKSTVWPASDGGKPYYIPAKTDIPYSIWQMHRRTDLWGPDATEFDPNRFLDGRLNKYLTPNPFIFLPFNAGPRICLGQQFAYNETSFMLIRLLQAFDTITLDADAQPPDSRPPASWKEATGTQRTDKIWPKVHLTLYSHKGLWVRMTEAKYTDTV